MAVLLNVPFVTQLGIGSHVPGNAGWDDPTGCWYASACMVGYYFGAGPRLGIPELFIRDLGHGQLGHQVIASMDVPGLPATDQLRRLAEREHMEPVANCATNHFFTLDELEGLLNQHGPIFFGWWKDTYGHASVIIGTSDTGIIYHDPENAPNSQMPLWRFHYKRFQDDYMMMQHAA